MWVSALICKGNRMLKPMIENHRVDDAGGSCARLGDAARAMPDGRPPVATRTRGRARATSKPPGGLPPRGVQSHTRRPSGSDRQKNSDLNCRPLEGRGGRVEGFKGVGPGL